MYLGYRKGIFGNGLIAEDACLYYWIDQLDQVKLCRRKCSGTYCYEHKNFSMMNRMEALSEIQSYDNAKRHQVDVDMSLEQNLIVSNRLLIEYRKLTMLRLNGELSQRQLALHDRMSAWVNEMSEIDMAMELSDEPESQDDSEFVDDNIIYKEPRRILIPNKRTFEEYVDDVVLFDD